MDTQEMSETLEMPKIHQLFSRLFYGLKRFVYFGSVLEYVIVSLTIIISFFQDAFDAVSYLHFEGPQDRGKTNVLKMIASAGFNSSYVLHATDAVTYRIIHQRKGIYILDEAEFLATPRMGSFSHRVFRSGYKKGALVWVCDKNDPYGFITYNVYGIKVTANIHGIYDEVLKSRYIVISMSEPNPEQRPEIFFPDSDGKLFDKIGSDLLLFSKKEDSKNLINDAYLNLKKDERIKEIRGRFFEKFAPYFASAKVIEKSAGREFLFEHVLKFAKGYIDQRKQDARFTDPNTMVILSLLKHVENKIEKNSKFDEHKYFWAEGLYEKVREDLEKQFGKLDFEFSLKKLGEILDTHRFLLSPKKRKVKRVKLEDDPAKYPDPAQHYHLDVEKMRLFANKFMENEDDDDDDLDKPADRGAL